MLEVHLPFPPTANNLFSNIRGSRGGRVISKAYKAWRLKAALSIYQQSLIPIMGPIKVEIWLGRPSQAKRDIDNYIKALLDALVNHRLIEGDHLVQSLRVSWCSKPGAKVVVEAWSAASMGPAA